MKLSHHVPIRMAPADPITPEYQAQVDQATDKAIVAWERARRRLTSAETRLARVEKRRGKYAKRAENQRDRDSLVSVAETAKQIAARQEVEASKAIGKLQRQVEALTADLNAAKALMLEVSSPEVRRLSGIVEEQRGRIQQQEKDLALLKKAFLRFDRRLLLTLTRTFDCSPIDAEALLAEAWLLTVGSDVRAMERLNQLTSTNRRKNALGRAEDAGRITPQQADAIRAARIGDKRLGHVDRRGEEDAKYGRTWTANDDAFGAWCVCAGDSVPLAVVEIYDNAEAAEAHAASGSDLIVLYVPMVMEFEASAVAA